MSAKRRLPLLLIVGTMICAEGCTSPKVTFLSSRCEAPKEGTRLKALVFVSTLDATKLQGEQLIYQVKLFDRDRTPLRSRDKRYQTTDGTVAATTTMMVLESPQTFKDVRVSIPAGELGVPPNRLPVLAEISVSTAGGERIAAVWRPIPLLRVADIMPPLTTTPAPVPYWFVKVTDPNRLPTLLGPFGSPKEAEAAVTETTESPKQINSDECLWFVPFYNSATEQKAILVGPCSCEKDARDIAGLLTGMPDLAPKGLVAGAPLEVQVRQWLKDREVNQILASRPAAAADNAPAKQSKRKHR